LLGFALMNSRRALLLCTLLIHVGACGSSGMKSSVDSGGRDQTGEAPDSQEASDRSPETPIDEGRDQPTPTCFEFPGCEKLIYDDRTGCPIGCVVSPPADASPADAG
jgi:hypothetical protein